MVVFVELQVPGPGPSPQLLAAQVRDLAVVDVEALDLVLAEVGHQEHPPGRLPVDLVEVRPALPVLQVLPPVRAVAVHVLRPGLAVHLHRLPQHPLLVHSEGGQLGVPVTDNYQVRLVVVPADVTGGPPVDPLAVQECQLPILPVENVVLLQL